jgi:hypothetical protein
MSHTKLPRVCALAAALMLGLTGVASASERSIYVPCAGPTATTGPTGLKNAVIAANANPSGTTTIKVDSGCAYVYKTSDSSSNPDNALPVIVKSIVIDGEPGGRENALILRSAAGGTPSFRLLEVGTNGRLTLKNITISGGRTRDGANGANGTPNGGNGANAPDGGGILNSGGLTLQHSIVTRNVTGNGGNGGNGNLGTGGNGGNGGNGGGVANRGTFLSKDGSSVSGNVTGNGGNGGSGNTQGGNGGNGGDGGGLYRSAGVAAFQDQSTVSGNATGSGGTGGDANGTGGNGGNGGGGGGVAGRSGNGGIALSGGGVLVGDNGTGNGGDGGNGNASGGNAGDGGDGGGAFLDASRLLFDGSALTGNATGAAGQNDTGGNATGGNGGGLAAENGSVAQLHKGSITWNTAATGGAIFSDASQVFIDGTFIANNSHPQCAGAAISGPCPA